MKKAQTLALFCALFLLTGCADPTAPTEPSTPTETVAPSADAVSSGTDTVPESSTIPLPTSDYFHHAMVKPAPEERCAATSMGVMVETELGYYFVAQHMRLYYADKSDLTNWIVVCNQPDCKHDKSPANSRRLGEPECHAYLHSSGIWEKNGHIYAMADHGEEKTRYDLILESPGDGSAWSVALADENSPFSTSNGLACGPAYHADGLCLHVCQMQGDGFWDSYLYFIDGDGIHKWVYAEDFPDMVSPYCGNFPRQSRGDLTMGLTREYPEADSVTEPELYRVSPECAEKLELPESCSYYGAYLSGDTMIHYHPNDGFYRLDYYAGTEEKIADAAYTDGFGYCLDGEFLVETTVNYQSTAKESKLRYFDGEIWTEVPMPEDMTPETSLRITALTSEALFLEKSELSGTLYVIKLGDDQLVKCMDYPAQN